MSRWILDFCHFEKSLLGCSSHYKFVFPIHASRQWLVIGLAGFLKSSWFILFIYARSVFIFHHNHIFGFSILSICEQLLLVQDGKLYGRDPIFAVITKAAALPEVTKNHDIQKNEYIVQLGQVNYWILWFFNELLHSLGLNLKIEYC